MSPSHQKPEQMLHALHVEPAAEGVRENARRHALAAFRKIQTKSQSESQSNTAVEGEHLKCENNTSPPADNSLNFARRDSDKISAQGLALSGLAGFFMAWAIASHVASLTPAMHLLLFSGFTAFPMILLNVFINKTHLRQTSGLLRSPGKTNIRRCGIKFIGLLATLALLGICYWLFPEYGKSDYSIVWETVRIAALPVCLITLFYLIWTDCRMADPEDGYWHFGMLVIGKWSRVDRSLLREYALGWLIKGIFSPFMLSVLAVHLDFLLREGWNFSTYASLYLTTFILLLTIDTTFGAIGYFLTLRVLDAQIRSVQPTWPGWVFTLMCYAPFGAFFNRAFLNYKGNIDWSNWLCKEPVVFILWGLAILTLTTIYLWATLSFGCRFSNLTNRGIIIDGPYRYTKHPAYLAKNLSWWLISVPFIAHGSFLMNLKGCLLLGLTNFIYFMRAKTEEFHLSEDPAYRLYADWIERNGLGSIIKNLFFLVRDRFFPRRLPDA